MGVDDSPDKTKKILWRGLLGVRQPPGCNYFGDSTIMGAYTTVFGIAETKESFIRRVADETAKCGLDLVSLDDIEIAYQNGKFVKFREMTHGFRVVAKAALSDGLVWETNWFTYESDESLN